MVACLAGAAEKPTTELDVGVGHAAVELAVAEKLAIVVVSERVAKCIVPVAVLVGHFGAIFEMDVQGVPEVALVAVHLVAEVAPPGILLVA